MLIVLSCSSSLIWHLAFSFVLIRIGHVNAQATSESDWNDAGVVLGLSPTEQGAEIQFNLAGVDFQHQLLLLDAVVSTLLRIHPLIPDANFKIAVAFLP